MGFNSAFKGLMYHIKNVGQKAASFFATDGFFKKYTDFIPYTYDCNTLALIMSYLKLKE